jgi:hypothetical protein
LLRKFGDAPPEEWIEAIDDLSDFSIRRGFKRLQHGWKGAGAPSLPDFVRFCTIIGDDAPGLPQPRPALKAPEGPKFDGWDISGNIRFWKYISHRLTESYRPWGAAWSTEHAECTCIAISYKNAWAADMREADIVDSHTGEITRPPEEEQARTFADCMTRAEADIATYRRGLAA